ncbi:MULTISPECIES: 4-hydroxythreonine-4-phosphate dehydrogenase [unclassified Helicobacter]|uniref:4-hydroxythreonine-4-phosphate dehydrogenase n=1 Tax=unclassified Helicobacter TaxID=2593540 RepID=UPI000CF07B0B|nr:MULTISPECIES: 4-hydroxythreonine-4-phosphate dehydrogenase [unclassified Helicobacter]
MYKVAICVGDINGIGPEILLKSHHIIEKYCQPFYCIHKELLQEIAKKLNLDFPAKANFIDLNTKIPSINVGKICADSGLYSYSSFLMACDLADSGLVDFITTLPIHKFAWKEAGIENIGHTDYLRERYQKDGIMMLGCEEMFVALFSDHIPLNKVSTLIKKENLKKFFLDFYKCIKEKNIAVLGLNPHCGDNGIIGKEDFIIKETIDEVNYDLKHEIFQGPISADSAFTPSQRKKYKYYIAFYHDIGLAPLKALYFSQSINVTLNIPILRTSVDHGVGFDIAYKNLADIQSYINAILLGIKLKDKQ